MERGIVIGNRFLVRKDIGYKGWRRVDVLTLGIFALATIHGLGTGSDTQTWWALGIYLVSLVLVGALFCRRIFSSRGKHKQAPARPTTLTRAASAVPQSNPSALNRARGGATQVTEQNRAEAARVK